MSESPRHLTRARIHLGRLTRNLRLLEAEAGDTPLWPAIKANAYGHGAEIVARHLVSLGYRTLCVAHAPEAIALHEAGVRGRFLLLSASLPEHAEAIVRHQLAPMVCTVEMLEASASAAATAGERVAIHVKVDTGMGRVGIRPEDAIAFLERCRTFPQLRVAGLMSHLARADETDKAFSHEQIRRFREIVAATRGYGIEHYHLANSAGILDLPEARFDVARPGIAIYGLAPSATMRNPRVAELEPVMELESAITYLKEVPGGTGLSYGHVFHTAEQSLIATLPIGYGDGLARGLSNRLDVLVHGLHCRQVGCITMDQILVDVTPLRGRVRLGDRAVLIGAQQGNAIRADDLARALNTINYEVVTNIAERVLRIPVYD